MALHATITAATERPFGPETIARLVTVIQVCSQCGTRWNVRDRQRAWCPRCHGALLAPAGSAAVPTAGGRPTVQPAAQPSSRGPSFRWIAVRPGPPPPPRRSRRPLGPTPRYAAIPRGGLVDRIAAPAPEQAAGKNHLKDERTDIYALGGILYAILTFESPLSGRPVNEIIVQTIHGNIGFPDAENQKRQLPAALQAVVLKAMSRNPEERYQSVDELREDIFAFLGGYAPKAEDASSLRKTYLFVNRNWLATLFLITLLLLIIACSWLGMLYYDGTLQW